MLLRETGAQFRAYHHIVIKPGDQSALIPEIDGIYDTPEEAQAQARRTGGSVRYIPQGTPYAIRGNRLIHGSSTHGFPSGLPDMKHP